MGNTIEELLEEIFRREKNIINILTGLQEVYTSSNPTVVIEWEDLDGQTQNYEISSINHITSKLSLLEQNQKAMGGVGVRRATLKLPDGTIKTIIASKLPVAPQAVTNMNAVTYFRSRTNDFSRQLTDPFVFAPVNLAGLVDENTKEVKYLHFKLYLDSTPKVDFFNNTLKGKSVDYETYLDLLRQQAISFDTYEQRSMLATRIPKFDGKFSVLSYQKKTVKSTADNTEQTLTLYTLNTLLYTYLGTDSTQSLKIGDQLIINNLDFNTVYEITYVDSGTNEVAFKVKEGYYPITISADTFVINSSYENGLFLELPIVKDEYATVFVKGINPSLSIEGAYWGSGLSFYANELQNYDDLTAEETFLQYYSDNVKNLNSAIALLSEEGAIPVSSGLKPNVPVLDAASLKVEVVNDHKKQASQFEEIRKKYSEKTEIQSKIAAVDSSILANRQELATNSKLTSLQIDQLEKSNTDLLNQRSSLVREFNSKIDEINAKITDDSLFEPKYQIIGFCSIPEPVYENPAEKLNPAETIAIEVERRYLTTTNTTTNTQAFSKVKNSNGIEEKAVMSKWERLPITKVREKDPSTRKWMVENLNDSESININQIRIPISRGENVEIRVRAVSEIGYPFAPLKSEWSAPIIVQFPNELIDSPDTIITNARNEQVLVKFNRELSLLGLDIHTRDSDTIGDKYYAHDLSNIATDELTPENKPKTGADVIREIRADIGGIQAMLLNQGGQPKVSITDEAGVKIKDINNNDTINIFAGYYKNLISAATIQKGEIVTKIYYIEVENVSDADLQLFSYVPGSKDDPVPNNDRYKNDGVTVNPYFDNYDGYIHNRDEFNSYRKFWNVPLSLRGITNNNTLYSHHSTKAYPYIQLPGFQSWQVRGSFIYMRERDLTLNTKLYKIDDTSVANQILKPIFTGSTTQSFIWDGSVTPITDIVVGSGYETDFCIHINHPDLKYAAEFMQGYSAGTPLYYTSGTSRTLPKQSFHTSLQKVFYPPFIHAAYFNKNVTEADGSVQLRLTKYSPTDELVSAADGAFPRKIGFTTNDKYLIGKNTCGAYLYLGPAINDQISTGQIVYNAGKSVKKGDSNKIRIPVVFEARLTDYYGAGDSGTGRISGDSTKTNVTFAKKIGVDLLFKDNPLFSFDVKVEIAYSPTTASLVNSNNQDVLNL